MTCSMWTIPNKFCHTIQRPLDSSGGRRIFCRTLHLSLRFLRSFRFSLHIGMIFGMMEKISARHSAGFLF